ncbi:MAG: hypothetical protein HYW26_05480 [Candidatus Aenigmarchaeota archaeon]|nr:hypothetical protein [Candidatus Aenigmarchaeota archaeon]
MKKTGKKNGKSIFGWLGSASGSGAIAGAHNVCHALCQGLVLFLALFGIAVSSTALMFLEDYAVYFWSMGLFFLLISAYFFAVRKQGSQKLLLANSGILLAGIPFRQFEAFSAAFLAAGGAMIAFSVFLYLNERNFLVFGNRNNGGRKNGKSG